MMGGFVSYIELVFLAKLSHIYIRIIYQRYDRYLHSNKLRLFIAHPGRKFSDPSNNRINDIYEFIAAGKAAFWCSVTYAGFTIRNMHLCASSRIVDMRHGPIGQEEHR